MGIRQNQRTGYIALILVLFSVAAFAQSTLTLSNKINIARTDELIVIKRAEVKRLLSARNPFLRISRSATEVVIQYDDLDQDGLWDEAIFLTTFAPLQHQIFDIKGSPYQAGTIVVKAHVRHRRKLADESFGINLNVDSIPANQSATDFSKQKLPPFLTEGPAWENDKVGFRLYFDVRNGKDIWGKTTSRMMMDTVGIDPKVIYHNRAPWGMDILKVGSSLSAGALALQFKSRNGQDTLVRLGGKNMGKVFYQKIVDGPIRAIFRMNYPEWHISNGYPDVSLTEEISISGGQYYYASNIKIYNAPVDAKLVTGFADLYQIPSGQLKTPKSQAFYAFGQQSENKDNLGLAIVTSLKDLVFSGKSPVAGKDIKDSYILGLRISKTGSGPTFRFYSAWEPTDSRFGHLDLFAAFLKEQLLIKDSDIVKRLK